MILNYLNLPTHATHGRWNCIHLIKKEEKREMVINLNFNFNILILKKLQN